MKNYVLEEILQQIGLSKVESDIYLLSLQHTGLPISAIARKLSLPRTTIYGYADKMIERWFLYKVKKSSWFVIASISPEDIIQLLQKRKKDIEENIDTVKSHIFDFNAYLSKSPDTPKIKYYEGEEWLALIYDKVKDSKTMYSYFNAAIVDKKYVDSVARIVKDNHIECKDLVIQNKEWITYRKKYKSKDHEIKLLGMKYIFHSDNIILDDRIFYISYGERIIALEVINPILVNTQKVIFNLAWDSLK